MKLAKRYKSMEALAASFGLPPSRGLEAEVKAVLTLAIIQGIEKQGLTHQNVAEAAGVARSTVSGIVNGSLQRVTIDRLIRILGAIGFGLQLKIKKAS